MGNITGIKLEWINIFVIILQVISYNVAVNAKKNSLLVHIAYYNCQINF